MEWTNEKPWQGLGVDIGSHLSAREMSVKLNLDWEVVKTPSQRPKSPANQETFRYFKAFTEAGDLQIETIGSLDDGRIIWVLVPLPGDFTLSGGDRMKAYLLMASRHENRLSVELQFMAVREICHNMLPVPVKIRTTFTNIFRRPFKTTFPFLDHSPQTFDAAIIKKARDTLVAGQEAVTAFQSDAGRLAHYKVDEPAALRYLFDVFQPELSKDLAAIGEKEMAEQADEKTRKAMEALAGAPGHDMESAQGTLWGLLNAVVHTVDHHFGKSRDFRLRQAWFGANSRIKKRALELAMQML